MEPEHQHPDLRDHVRLLVSRKWTILIVTVLVVASTIFFSYRQDPVYSASARLLLEPIPTSGTSYAAPPNLTTESQILSSVPVAELVRDELSLESSAEALLSNLSVEAVAESEVLRITYSSGVPDETAVVANAFAEAYVDYKRDQALEALSTGQEAIQQRIVRVQSRLSTTTERLEQARQQGDASEVTRFESERSILLAQLGTLFQQLDALQGERLIREGGGEVIEPATVPSVPSSPNHSINALMGVVLGLALGVGVAVLRDRFDTRFRNHLDVARALHAPVLASIPRYEESLGPYQLVSIAAPLSPAAEAYKTLRASIEFLARQRGFSTLAVASPSAGEGKTVTVANLGTVLAQAGNRVVVVSSDLRRPTLESYFGVARGVGLSEWLWGTPLPLADVLLPTGIPNLRVLPSGAIPNNPAELLAGTRLEQLIETLHTVSDFVIFDSPPLLPVADALALAAHVQHVVIVVDARSTHRSGAVHAREQLAKVGASIIGAVINSFDQGATPYTYGRYEGRSLYDSIEEAPQVEQRI